MKSKVIDDIDKLMVENYPRILYTSDSLIKKARNHSREDVPMPLIELTDIRKTFRVHERPEGRWGLLKGMFIRHTRAVHALDGISFSIGPGELVGMI
ncbi:MAG: hypothetical protein FWG37_05570, partial [Clostridia bacterium]|nr:hypothetical protein [Clostridia bacterium]